MKQKKSEFEKGMDELLRNPYMKKTLSDLGIGKGRVYNFMTKIREGRVSDDEIVEHIKKEDKKFEKAEIQLQIQNLRKMAKKAPNTWDECKTEEQKKAFMAEIEHIDKTSKFIPFDEHLRKQKK